MSTYFRVFLIFIALVIVISDCIIIIFSKKKGLHIKTTDVGVFIAEKLFVIGEFILQKAAISRAVRNRRKLLLLEIYDRNKANQISENADYAIPTYIAVFTPVAIFISALSESIEVLIILFALIGLICVYFDVWLNNRISKRRAAIQHDFATILTKMSLLVNAGLTASDAFERVAYSGSGLLYLEMQRAVSDITNGVSIDMALAGLATRGGCKEVKKFVSLYKQNLVKGSSDFPFLLSEMADAAWIDKKNRARLAGGVASQKLLFPIMLMFSGVILMVIVPAFNSLL